MKIVTAGIGRRAGHVLSDLKSAMPEIEFAGYYDPQPTHLDMIGDDVPCYPSVSAMLSDAQPDLFFVGSPNSFHLEHIKLGLESGVQVFSEKPVVTTIEDTMALAYLLQQHGEQRVMVGLVLRYSRHMVDLRNVLAELGPITSMEANEHIAPYHGAFFMRDWRRKTALTGGFMLEKCCHDLDIYNMITASRPIKVASFGGKGSYLPQYAPESSSQDDLFHIKKSVWSSVDDPFRSDADIIDYQTGILQYESGANLAFHTNLNVPDEHRRFCVMGALGMAEGDFQRGYLKATARDGRVIAKHDYSMADPTGSKGHYGADQMMAADLAAYLREEIESLPVSVVDALEAGIAALALDQARIEGRVVDLAETWKVFDGYGLRP